jgi:hypothetical protein
VTPTAPVIAATKAVIAEHARPRRIFLPSSRFAAARA